MKTLQNFINEGHANDWEQIGENLENYSLVLYYAFLHADSIIEFVEEYEPEDDDDDSINWGDCYGYGTLTDEATEALMYGEGSGDPEYNLMIRCAEAEAENKGGYWKQLEKELKAVNETLMKES